jgi:DNA-binding IclR family transcriptional regulator
MAEMDDGGDARQGIGSVEMAARVLFALEEGGGPLTLNQIAQRCGEQPSKIHRYLVSLGRAGLTVQSGATGKYDLGPASRRLGGEALRRTNEVAIVSEHSLLLSERTGHSVNLTVWSDDGPVIVRWDYGAHALSLTARVGATLPLVQSAAGQVFLAHLPAPMTDHALALALERTPGLTRRDAERAAHEVRVGGFGVSDGGFVSDVFTVAAGVFSAADALPLVMTVAIRRDQANDHERESVRRELASSVKDASAELGVGGELD